MKGRLLVINTGSTSTKIALYDSGSKLFEQNITLDSAVLAKYNSVMDLDLESRDAITVFLSSKGVPVESVDIVMARGGLVTPVVTGVYEVNKAMCDTLRTGRDGVHACNLSAIIAYDIAEMINEIRAKNGDGRICKAYIADPPMADEMLPELKLGGRPSSRAVRSFTLSIPGLWSDAMQGVRVRRTGRLLSLWLILAVVLLFHFTETVW